MTTAVTHSRIIYVSYEIVNCRCLLMRR